MRPRLRPVIIIGGGVAGLSAALELAPRPVILVCRGRLGEDGATTLAQGGIAAALGRGDHPRQHAADTLEAGAGRCAVGPVRHLAAAAPGAIGWLAARGIAFERDADGLRLGREGGHGRARIVHAGGDATGAHVARGLASALRRCGHALIVQDAEVDALLVGPDGRVGGVRVREAGGAPYRLAAAEVVLATGGVGGLFAQATGPRHLDGLGLALALAVGAPLRDLEYLQFHPTALRVPACADAPLPLVTEALRGEGAVLRDASGRRLMVGVAPRADLAPRDIVARVVAGSAGAWLDATRLELDWEARFPTVLAAAARHGFDPRRHPLPVCAAQHFHMGGVAAGLDGATAVPGLSAIGEVACTGVHGANRLASNSLLEGVICGRLAGQRLRATASPAEGSLRVAAAGEPLDREGLANLRETLSATLGPVRDLAAVAALREALPAETRQHRVARALLGAAASNPRRLGAHWPADGSALASA